MNKKNLLIQAYQELGNANVDWDEVKKNLSEFVTVNK